MITFNTLKKYARRGHLKHIIHGEFCGMVDGMRVKPFDPPTETTLHDLKKFKATKNYLSINPKGHFRLQNCIYDVTFIVEAV